MKKSLLSLILIFQMIFLSVAGAESTGILSDWTEEELLALREELNTELARREEGQESTNEAPPVPEEPEESTEKKPKQKMEFGTVVLFGRFEQDNNLANGPEEIEWYVLDYNEENNSVLLLARYSLINKRYHRDEFTVSWKACDLRKWMNGEFLENSFTGEEQSAILTTTLNYENDETIFGKFDMRDSLKTTEDKVFLLSCWEAKYYLNCYRDYSDETPTTPSPLATLIPTAYAYAVANGIYTKYFEPGDPVSWWTRTPDQNDTLHRQFYVYEGRIIPGYPDSTLDAVRPALWLDLNSINPGIVEGPIVSASADSYSIPSGSASSTSIHSYSPVSSLISSAPSLSSATQNTREFYSNAAELYNQTFPAGSHTWWISLQGAVVAFADENNMTALTFKPAGTAGEIASILKWRIKVLEAIPDIQTYARQNGIHLIVEERSSGSDYASYRDSNGVIDLLDSWRYDGVLKESHDLLGTLEMIDAFSGLGALDTNGNGQIDFEELFEQ